ncbi:hypothetical protein AB0P12_00760 [Streptomyces subrutilus]|uniref:YqeB family protein n=1 Tax=Streptomyces subrutilus TaxID=36818 RepID=UPI003424BECA
METDKSGPARREPEGGRLTVVGQAVWTTVGVYAVLAALGAAVGWGLGPLADWLVTLPWAPLQGPAELVGTVPAGVLPAVGAVAGLVLGLVAQHEQLTLRLSGDRLVLASEGREREFSRAAVAVAFLDRKQLVLLGHDGGELVRQGCELAPGRVADAFAAHGFAWADADPYEAEFRRWVPGAPGLPEGANAVLAARRKPLEKNGPADGDARELREELARLGVVVRDVKRRQYWRSHGRPGGPGLPSDG